MSSKRCRESSRWARLLLSGCACLGAALLGGCYEDVSCELGFSVTSPALIGVHDWTGADCSLTPSSLAISEDNRSWLVQIPGSWGLSLVEGAQAVSATYSEGGKSWTRQCELDLFTLESEEWTSGTRTRIVGTMACEPLNPIGDGSPLTLERFELSAFIEEFSI